jgi:hypothetical protein
MPERNPQKYLAQKFVHAWSASERLGERVVRRRGVFVNAIRREVRVRKLGTGTIALPLGEGAARWILERVREGARLVTAMVRVDGSKLCVALIFRRDVKPVEAEARSGARPQRTAQRHRVRRRRAGAGAREVYTEA